MTKIGEYLRAALSGAIFSGGYIPAHDECFDLAERIARDLATFHAYVTGVRDREQADEALEELGQAIKSATYDASRLPAPN